MNKDTIMVKNNLGLYEEVELIISFKKNNKQYIVYKDKDEEIYASYFLDGDDKLYNDLSEEEYKMLEEIMKKGSDIND